MAIRLASYVDWLENMWEHAFKNADMPESSCQHCPALDVDCGYGPWDSLEEDQGGWCSYACEANDAMECPYVYRIVNQLVEELH